MRHPDLHQTRANIRRCAGQGLHADVVDLIEGAIAAGHEVMEQKNDSIEILREQGGIRALRQLLADITPRTERGNP